MHVLKHCRAESHMQNLHFSSTKNVPRKVYTFTITWTMLQNKYNSLPKTQNLSLLIKNNINTPARPLSLKLVHNYSKNICKNESTFVLDKTMQVDPTLHLVCQFYSFWKKERTRSVCTEKSCVSTKSFIKGRSRLGNDSIKLSFKSKDTLSSLDWTFVIVCERRLEQRESK